MLSVLYADYHVFIVMLSVVIFNDVMLCVLALLRIIICF
jgi:hypothetical protein